MASCNQLQRTHLAGGSGELGSPGLVTQAEFTEHRAAQLEAAAGSAGEAVTLAIIICGCHEVTLLVCGGCLCSGRSSRHRRCRELWTLPCWPPNTVRFSSRTVPAILAENTQPPPTGVQYECHSNDFSNTFFQMLLLCTTAVAVR